MFLASKYIGGLGQALPREPRGMKLAYVTAATGPYEEPHWVDITKSRLNNAGFIWKEITCEMSSAEELANELSSAEVILVEGGNTFSLLDWANRLDFFHACRSSTALYAGISAGAVALCPDVDYVASMDDRTAAPGLKSTQGAGWVSGFILPHVDDVRYVGQVAAARAAIPSGSRIIELRDDQALWIENGIERIVESKNSAI